jgi:hypothetical protein
MAATDTTQESTLIVAADQAGSVSTTERNGTTTRRINGRVTGAEGTFSEGRTVFRGGPVRRSTFSFTDPGAEARANFTNNVANTDFIGTSRAESIRFAANVNNVDIKMDGGPDSIQFGGGANVVNTVIDLGQDTGRDIVEFASLDNVRNTTIKNFGRTDTLKIGGQTFTYNDLQNADFGDKLIIKFND